MAFDIYKAVSDRIIAQLENGVIPWHKPWTTYGAVKGWKAESRPVDTRNLAFSHSTGRPYSLLNQMLLGRAGEYLTFKQVTAAGGKVKKGEKSSMVVFWKMLTIEDTDETGTKKTKNVPVLRYYNVFHIDQCEDVKPRKKVAVETVLVPEPLAVLDGEKFPRNAEAEKVIANYLQRSGVTLTEDGGDRAYYQPSTDAIHVPHLNQFENVSEFYGTEFHELTHSTGHPKRLDRIVPTTFGSHEYSKEELVAEIGSAAILNYLNMETQSQFTNSVAYIQGWVSKLKNDPRFIVSAASKAEKAMSLILGDMEMPVKKNESEVA